MRAFIDSDILIWHLRGKREARDFFRRMRNEQGYELWTGAMQRAEVVFFMKEDEEKQTLQFLSQFKTEPVDRHLVDAAGELYGTWHSNCGIDVNDALLAASARRSGGMIFSLNTKHYPMDDVPVTRAW